VTNTALAAPAIPTALRLGFGRRPTSNLHQLRVAAAKIWVIRFNHLLSANHTAPAHFFLWLFCCSTNPAGIMVGYAICETAPKLSEVIGLVRATQYERAFNTSV